MATACLETAVSPVGWPWRPLGEVAQVIAGQSPPSSTYNSDGRGLPFFQGKAEFGRDVPTPVKWCEAPTKIAQTGDILISVRAPVGPTNYAPFDCGIGRGLAAIRVGREVDTRWLRYWLGFSHGSLVEKATGTTFEAITGAVLRAHECPIPPIETQRRIVARIDELFSELDDGEAELKRARADLATYRKALLKATVTGELTADWRAAHPSDQKGEVLLQSVLAERARAWERGVRKRKKRYNEPVMPDRRSLPQLPLEWTWASLDQLSWASGYGTSQKCDPDGAGEPVLRIPNLKAGSINLADLKRSRVSLELAADDYVLPGDLLIVRTNGSEDLIGRTGILAEPLATPTHYASYLIRFRMTGGPERWRWIRAFTESPVFRASILNSIGSSAGQYNLSMSKLAAFPIALPPDREIAEILTRWNDASLDWDEDTADTSSMLRQSILAAAFRGELVQ